MSVYAKFGLSPIINASGAVTRLGGAPMPREVVEAFVAAAGETVPLEQLQAAASREIAQVTGAEAGLVTAGSAAALTLGTAAILAGFDSGRMERLPHCEGFPHEFLIAREQRSGYDHAVRAAGARLVEVGFNEIVAHAGVRRTEAWEYDAACGPNTAGIVYGYSPDSQPPLNEVIAVARQRGIPILVDAAGELPPRKNLTSLIAAGADLVGFSGGKSIRGPQSTGILCGRRDLVASAAVQMLDMDDHFSLWSPPPEFLEKSRFRGMPRHGIGRAMKVSKEEIVALLTALRLFASGAYDADMPRAHRCLQLIRDGLETAPVRCELDDVGDGQCPPRMRIRLTDPAADAFAVCRALRQGTPAIYVSHGQLADRTLVIIPLWLTEADATIIGRRITEVLQEPRA